MMPENNKTLTANIKASGCAAKISAAQLAEIVHGLPDFNVPELLTTIRSFEDAAVYKISDQTAVVQTVDFFPPMVDDPFLFGRIAACNALSDIYAMGGRPTIALSILCFPVCDQPLSVASQIIQGAAATLKEAGAALAGGHSIQGSETLYGLAVSGIIDPQKILTNGGARPQDTIVLTKPLGTGVLLLAHKAGLLNESEETQLFNSMTKLNGQSLSIAQKFQISAATDVTGFGLIGHVREMALGAGLQATITASAIPLLPAAIMHAEQGLVPAGAYANRTSYESALYMDAKIDLPLADLLFDPQTSGGLLLALPNDQAERLVSDLKRSGLPGAIIGRFVKGEAGKVEVV